MLAFQNHKWPSAAPATANLFSGTPATINTTDSTGYELGTHFKTTVAGSVTGLRYWKGTSGAETRTLNLWRWNGGESGTNLGSVSVSPGSGVTGWVTGMLASPVALTVGQFYTASFGKASAQSYAADQFYFSSARTNGVLTMPVDAGVFSYLDVGAFPFGSFNGSAYYADVIFQPS